MFHFIPRLGSDLGIHDVVMHKALLIAARAGIRQQVWMLS